MIALSTSWNAWRYSQAKDVIKEIKALGFNCVELNFSLSPAMVDQMIALKKHGLIKVVSLHNFCPVPPGISRKEALPDTFSLSAAEEQERQKALRFTKKTIDTASKLGAEVVVLHAGKIKAQERIRELALVYESGQKQKCEQLKAQMLKERKAKSKKFFDQAIRSLGELCTYAQRQKVKLGIENRYYFYEIPSAEEMEVILKKFGPPLYYWHDVGHAQVYENLGFIKHREVLDRFSRRMIGMHLHDIEGTDDHRAPLKGTFDFRQLLPYIKSDTLKVIEAHHPATAEEIAQGKKYLEKIFEVKKA